VLALLAPGQGAQTPGMLRPWLDLPGARDALARWSCLTGLDLTRLGTTAGADELRDTAVAQALLTAAALLSAEALLAEGAPDVVCGHSVGEVPALALAGALDADTAVRLAAERGAAMARAAGLRGTGMAAVLGADLGTVGPAAERFGLEVATVNGPGQVVVGGPVEGLSALTAAPPAGTRLRRLDVAGAFHTRAMLSAVASFAAVVADLAARQPRAAVVTNADGAVVADLAELGDRLVRQLTAPVRFDLCLQRLELLRVNAVVELAPGGTLAGIVKRALPGVPVVAMRGPDDLPAARALVDARTAVAS
jgi:[acyl-carrier-protein] S-malonyltransferase